MSGEEEELGEKREEALRRFRRLLLESIDEGLNVLGESIKDTVYFYINRKNDLKREEIPSRPEEFSRALKSIFGSVGAGFIEDQILKNLYMKVGAEYVKEKNLTFKDHVENAMEAYLRKASS